MIGTIYKYTNTINNKIYIGQTINEKERIKQHRNCCSDSYFHNAIKKYGFDSFKYEVVFKTDNINDTKLLKDILNEKEIYYIDYYDSYNNGYNMTRGGNGFLGLEFTEEHKRKISESLKGIKRNENTKKKLSEIAKCRINPMLGKKHTEESKSKMSENRKGIKVIFTEEHKKKIGEKHKKPILFYKDNVFIKEFDSVVECAKYLNKPTSTIRNVIYGLSKITKEGYTFKYKIMEE